MNSRLAMLIAFGLLLCRQALAGAPGEVPFRLWRTDTMLPGASVIALAQTEDGYLWVGTRYGLAAFDGVRFSTVDPARLGVANLGNTVMETGTGNTLWIGTTNGELLRWSGGDFQQCLPRAENGDAVWRIHPTGPDSVVALRKQGVWQWSEQTGARLLANPGPLEVLTGPQGVTTLRTALDGTGRLYFFSQGKCWRLHDDQVSELRLEEEKIEGSRLWDAIAATDGRVWLLSDRRLLREKDGGAWQALPPPPGDDGLEWTGNFLGTLPDGGLWLLLNKRLRRAGPGGWAADAGPWPPADLNSPAYVAPDGRLYAALKSGDMLCVLPDGRRLQFPGAPQIQNNRLERLLVDREGNLWGGSGDSWLVSWPAAALPEPPRADTAARVPVPHVEACRCAGVEMRPPFPRGGITAPAGADAAEFVFTGILLGAPDAVRFRCRLSGLEEEWRESTERTIRYASLPPGRYSFEVQASAPGGPWSSASVLAVKVPAFFWQTIWFRLLLAAAAAGAVAFPFWTLLRRGHSRRMAALELEKARQAERLRLARDLHDDLGSRLTHLSLVADMASHDDENAGPPLQTLCEGLRSAISSLDEIVWTVDPRRDTLPDVAEYLIASTAAMLREGGVPCEIQPGGPLPPLFVQSEQRHHLLLAAREAAQNVLKHAHTARAVLQCSLGDGVFTFTLADSGAGFDPSIVSAGDGLRNMRERLAHAGGTADICAVPGEGCRISIRLPLSSHD